MAKNKPKKRGKSGGFFARVFDVFTALIIIALISAAVWYWFFYSEKNGGGSIKKAIKGLYEKDSDAENKNTVKRTEKTELPVIDEDADDDYMESVDKDIIGGDDEMTDQYDSELASNYASDEDSGKGSGMNGFYRSVNKWAAEYVDLKVKNNTDPDENGTTDNSHLICSIWENAAKENKMKFRGYMPSDKILEGIYKIGINDIREGDLMVLKDGMFGMITDFKSPENYELIYASGEKNKVVKIDLKTMKNYWLKPEKFKGYYRAEKEILN
ncbi:TPA: hypothetical protein DCR49_11220 [Candidatus Delongbacteria bacterium]|nr:hypothetical protein [Candidatus Delongbacteria bacterium]